MTGKSSSRRFKRRRKRRIRRKNKEGIEEKNYKVLKKFVIYVERRRNKKRKRSRINHLKTMIKINMQRKRNGKELV